MAENKIDRSSTPDYAVPILKSSEVCLMDKVLGSGGFCSVSPVRWIKQANPQQQDSASTSTTTVSVVPINTPVPAPSKVDANIGQENARNRLFKQFKDYEEKYHSRNDIGVPGRTPPQEQIDPFAQKPPRIALKRIKPSLRKDRHKIGMNDLIAEASVLAKCSHSNIISLYAVGCYDDDDDDSTELKDGAGDNSNNAVSPIPSNMTFMIIDQLRSTLKNKMYKWNEDRGITPSFMKSRKALDDLWLERMVVIFKLADAIQYLHSKGIMHRDINPENIGFTHDNVVKLFDFGLAKSIDRNQQQNSDGTSEGCLEGDDNATFDLTSLTGTLRYMSPEVALEMPYGFKVDVYSFSLVMHEILSFTKPFLKYKAQAALTEEVFKGGRRPLIDETWPTEIKNVVQEMWSADCAKRPSSKELVDRLGALLRGDDDYLYPSTHDGWTKRFF
mmetsp:Transcript_2754/g.3719  ORF Transcript_2754/g.3719 Transcript_2754/m.3719 type:complete len:444 (-) Transcript_2754:56-1387(-)